MVIQSRQSYTLNDYRFPLSFIEYIISFNFNAPQTNFISMGFTESIIRFHILETPKISKGYMLVYSYAMW